MTNTTASRSTVSATPVGAPGPDTDAPAVSVEALRRAIARRSFCTLATTSENDRPHVAGVLYVALDDELYVHMLRTSRKARNLASNPHVAVTIPIRRLPVGPPSNVQFQGTAEIVDDGDARLAAHLASGALKKIAGHDALDEPDGCFVRITPGPTVHTYGIGMSLVRLLRDPLHAGGRVELRRKRLER